MRLLIGRKRLDVVLSQMWRTLPFHKMDLGLPLNKSVVVTITPTSRLFCSADGSSGDTLWLTKEIERKRVYTRLFEPMLGDTVIDAGAHVGIFTLRASRKVGKSGLVVAVEPHPNNYSFLVENVKANGLEQNVVPINVALADFNGRVKLYLYPKSDCHSLLPHIQPHWRATRSIEVEARTLDSLVNELGLKRCDFMKIDVEGYELEVLKGAQESLKRTSKVVVAAYHMPGQVEAVKGFLASREFKVSTMESFVYGSRRDFL